MSEIIRMSKAKTLLPRRGSLFFANLCKVHIKIISISFFFKEL